MVLDLSFVFCHDSVTSKKFVRALHIEMECYTFIVIQFLSYSSISDNRQVLLTYEDEVQTV
jgi:hypothetical protein